MKSYLVTLFNNKKGRQERYNTQAENEDDAVLALSLFLENGYELLEIEETDSERK